MILEDVISKYIDPTNSQIPKVLKPYQKGGMDSIDVLMKAEKSFEPLKK